MSRTVGPLVPVSEVASLLSVHIATVYKWIHAGKIPYISPSPGTYRFSLSEIERWLESCTHRPSSFVSMPAEAALSSTKTLQALLG